MRTVAASASSPRDPAVGAELPVLLLLADTGGGHAAAAAAVAGALQRVGSIRFAPVLFDPLAAPESSRLLRAAGALYEPLIRRAPWLWGALYHATDSWVGAALLRLLTLRVTDPVVAAVQRTRPVAIVSLHPLTGRAAVRARDRVAPGAPVLGVVTDLVQRHRVWDDQRLDRLALPAAAVGPRRHMRQLVRVAGLPVSAQFGAGPAQTRERAALRGWLGTDADRFLVLVTGGAAGAGPMARQVRALARLDGVSVVAVCGHNRRLARRLAPLARWSAGRVRVLGFVENMADWLRCADVVIGKAGPGAALVGISCPGSQRE